MRMQVGSCFSELVVGVDGGLRTYGLTQDASWQAIQQQWMQRFRDFAIKAQYRTEALRYGSAPARPEPLVGLAWKAYCIWFPVPWVLDGCGVHHSMPMARMAGLRGSKQACHARARCMLREEGSCSGAE